MLSPYSYIVVNNSRPFDMSAQRDKFITHLGHRGCKEEVRLPLSIVFLVEINFGGSSPFRLLG
jgi:hypothetical protein